MDPEEAEILISFWERISDQKDLEPEYQQFISDHFWELV
jgi:hypothetical protein